MIVRPTRTGSAATWVAPRDSSDCESSKEEEIGVRRKTRLLTALPRASVLMAAASHDLNGAEAAVQATASAAPLPPTQHSQSRPQEPAVSGSSKSAAKTSRASAPSKRDSKSKAGEGPHSTAKRLSSNAAALSMQRPAKASAAVTSMSAQRNVCEMFGLLDLTEELAASEVVNVRDHQSEKAWVEYKRLRTGKASSDESDDYVSESEYYGIYHSPEAFRAAAVASYKSWLAAEHIEETPSMELLLRGIQVASVSPEDAGNGPSDLQTLETVVRLWSPYKLTRAVELRFASHYRALSWGIEFHWSLSFALLPAAEGGTKHVTLLFNQYTNEDLGGPLNLKLEHPDGTGMTRTALKKMRKWLVGNEFPDISDWAFILLVLTASGAWPIKGKRSCFPSSGYCWTPSKETAELMEFNGIPFSASLKCSWDEHAVRTAAGALRPSDHFYQVFDQRAAIAKHAKVSRDYIRDNMLEDDEDDCQCTSSDYDDDE